MKRQLSIIEKTKKVYKFEDLMDLVLTVTSYRAMRKDRRILISKLLYSKYLSVKLNNDREIEYEDINDFLNNLQIDSKESNLLKEPTDLLANSKLFWDLNAKLDEKIGPINHNCPKSCNSSQTLDLNLKLNELKELKYKLANISVVLEKLCTSVDVANSLTKCSKLIPISNELYEGKELEEISEIGQFYLDEIKNKIDNNFYSEYCCQEFIERILKKRLDFYEKFNQFLDQHIVEKTNLNYVDECNKISCENPQGFHEFSTFENIIKSLESDIKIITLTKK